MMRPYYRAAIRSLCFCCHVSFLSKFTTHEELRLALLEMERAGVRRKFLGGYGR